MRYTKKHHELIRKVEVVTGLRYSRTQIDKYIKSTNWNMPISKRLSYALDNIHLFVRHIKENKLPFKKTNNLISVSDHAILRYIERVKGIDMDKIKSEILTPEFCDIYASMSIDGEFPNGHGLKYRVKNGRIITIIK